MKQENKQQAGAEQRKFKALILFLSDVVWFLKGWRPLTIKWEEPYKTKIRWSLARKRHAIKRCASEIKKSNAPNKLEQRNKEAKA